MSKTFWMTALALVLAAPNALAVGEMIEQEPTDAAREPNAPMAEAEETTEPVGWVERASFTRAVENREPRDTVATLTNDHTGIVFFTELRGMEGHTVTHVWEKDGEVMARVPIVVGAPRWRAYSTKNLEPSWIGEWKVNVVDENGRVIHTDRFSYVAVTAEPEAPADTETAADMELSEELPPPASME